MAIRIESNWDHDDFAADIMRQALDDAHEHFAQDVAAAAREDGKTTADDVVVEIGADSDVEIDVERVRARANEILKED